jgi:DNA-binding NtrC family response regulator
MMQRILVVDDDGLVRRGVHRLLARAGYEVWETAGARVALELLERMPMDLVITDIYMPGMNGIDFISHLERRDGCSHVIAMTGGGYRSPGELLAEAAGAGAERTLAKPVTADDLLGVVRDVLDKPAPVGKPSLPVAASPVREPRPSPAVLDLAVH